MRALSPVSALLAVVLVVCPALAQADPRMSEERLVGAFRLHYFGKLDDATVCPASPNRMRHAVERDGDFIYVHALAVDGSTDPALAPLFAEGSYCSLAFSGAVVLRRHHGVAATILPEAVSGREPDGVSDSVAEPDFSGRFSIGYQPIMCLIPPCPPGSYDIADEKGEAIARVGVLMVEAADGSVAEIAGQYLDFERAEGRIYLEEDGRRARIVVERILE